MEKYKIYLRKLAYADLASIYQYISKEFQEPGVAAKMVETIEIELLSLAIMPNRYPLRRIGAYANRDFRNYAVKNYIVIYRVDEEKKTVTIIRIIHSLQNH